MKKIEWDKLQLLFFIGGAIFVFIEMVFTSIAKSISSGNFRLVGQSSIYMFLLGGLIFLILGKLNETDKIRNLHLIIQSLIGGIIITILEFIVGMFLNVLFKLNIWDYINKPFASLFYNQINLYHSILWFLLSPFAYWLDDNIRYDLCKLDGKKRLIIPYNLFWYYSHLFRLNAPLLVKIL